MICLHLLGIPLMRQQAAVEGAFDDDRAINLLDEITGRRRPAVVTLGETEPSRQGTRRRCREDSGPHAAKGPHASNQSVTALAHCIRTRYDVVEEAPLRQPAKAGGRSSRDALTFRRTPSVPGWQGAGGHRDLTCSARQRPLPSSWQQGQDHGRS